MSQFEFFMVIASILVAIAITEVVGWWGKLIRNKQIKKVGGLHLGWSALFICVIVLYWTGFWSYEHVKIVNYAQIWMLLLPTLLAILGAYAITPTSADPSFSFRTYYEQNRKFIFFCWGFFIVGALIADVIMLGSFDLKGSIPGFVTIGLFIACRLTKNNWVNYAALFILYTLFLLLPFVIGFRETLHLFSGA